MSSLKSHIERAAEKHKNFDQVVLRYNHPRKCKFSEMDNPAQFKFGVPVWLRSKIGETDEYVFAPRKKSDPFDKHTEFDFVAYEQKPEDRVPPLDDKYFIAAYIDIPKTRALLRSGKAIIGTILQFGEEFSAEPGTDKMIGHALAYLLRPAIMNHPLHQNSPPTFFILESYPIDTAVEEAFKYFFEHRFDPQHTMPTVQVQEINQTRLQIHDELCVSWSMQMLYYLAKMPIEQLEMQDGRAVTVVKPLKLNEVPASLINKMMQKLKNDTGELTDTSTAEEAFPFLFGSSKPTFY